MTTSMMMRRRMATGGTAAAAHMQVATRAPPFPMRAPKSLCSARTTTEGTQQQSSVSSHRRMHMGERKEISSEIF